jgi:hypothetical protein
MLNSRRSTANHTRGWRARTLADELSAVSSILASQAEPERLEGQGTLEEFTLPANTPAAPETELRASRIPSELALAVRWGLAEDGKTPLEKGGHTLRPRKGKDRVSKDNRGSTTRGRASYASVTAAAATSPMVPGGFKSPKIEVISTGTIPTTSKLSATQPGEDKQASKPDGGLLVLGMDAEGFVKTDKWAHLQTSTAPSKMKATRQFFFDWFEDQGIPGELGALPDWPETPVKKSKVILELPEVKVSSESQAR